MSFIPKRPNTGPYELFGGENGTTDAGGAILEDGRIKQRLPKRLKQEPRYL
jgi:hypothetical protein